MASSHVKGGLSPNNNQGDPSVNFSTANADDQVHMLAADPEFAFSDGNIELQISDHKFWVHEFLLSKFNKIAELIRQARGRGELTAYPERRTIIHIRGTGKVRCTDIQNAFRVIYSSMSFVFSPVPPSFDVATLVSTLRVATLFQNPDLRNFAISQLESIKHSAAAIDRIALSDELKLPDWEVPAFAELCRRPEPISAEEAKILGINRFVEIARMREIEQRQRFVELVNQVATDPFLDDDGTVIKDKLEAVAEKTLKHPSLPPCECQTFAQPGSQSAFGQPQPGGIFGQSGFGAFGQHSAFGQPSPKPPVIDCQIHQLAPSVASESRTLYKCLSGVLESVGPLKRSVSALTYSFSGDGKDYSVENELKQASWVRKAV
ncbi:hypothetical protein B0J17DRAFT_639621 [Rhizoctonia solani]|nr:hypothetical protein B0J17DRAFT_639621 [Rhizoctonia solani]